MDFQKKAIFQQSVAIRLQIWLLIVCIAKILLSKHQTSSGGFYEI